MKKELENLISNLQDAQKEDISKEQFGKLFSHAKNILELDVIAVATAFKISKPTVTRWESGKSAPHPVVRLPVFQLFEELAKSKLENEYDN